MLSCAFFTIYFLLAVSRTYSQVSGASNPRKPLSVSHYFCVIEGRRIAVQIVSTVPDSFWSQGSVHADFSTSSHTLF